MIVRIDDRKWPVLWKEVFMIRCGPMLIAAKWVTERDVLIQYQGSKGCRHDIMEEQYQWRDVSIKYERIGDWGYVFHRKTGKYDSGRVDWEDGQKRTGPRLDSHP